MNDKYNSSKCCSSIHTYLSAAGDVASHQTEARRNRSDIISVQNPSPTDVSQIVSCSITSGWLPTKKLCVHIRQPIVLHHEVNPSTKCSTTPHSQHLIIYIKCVNQHQFNLSTPSQKIAVPSTSIDEFLQQRFSLRQQRARAAQSLWQFVDGIGTFYKGSTKVARCK